MHRQRQLRSRGKLSRERTERLKGLGVVWDPRAALWEMRFAELVRYKEDHGDCDVPSDWNENPPLGSWVIHQRKRARNGLMTDEQRRRLEQIGFRF